MRLPVLAVLVVTGCVTDADPHNDSGTYDDEKIVTLAELESPSLRISLPGPSLSVRLAYEVPAEHCPVLGKELTARVAGVDIAIINRGGAGQVVDPDYDDRCEDVVMELWIRPAVSEAILELSDPSLTIRCVLGDALLPRAALIPLDSVDCGGVPNVIVGA